jgi:hypothetical protein
LIPLPILSAVYPDHKRRLARPKSPWPQVLRLFGGIVGFTMALQAIRAVSGKALLRSSFALNHAVMLPTFVLGIESLSRAPCGFERLAGFDTTPIILNAYPDAGWITGLGRGELTPASTRRSGPWTRSRMRTSASMPYQRRRCLAGAPPLLVHRLALLPEPLYLREVVRVLARIARALQAAHAARVVHRDVKPRNILLDRHDPVRVYLIDFGLGRDLDVATPPQLRAREGTLGYMAPERLLGRRVDGVLSDVYALGVTLFESVTLRSPWALPESLPRAALAAYLAGAEPLRPGAARPGLPAALEAIVARAMAREPARRYPSAAAVAADLDRFAAGAPERPTPRLAPGDVAEEE